MISISISIRTGSSSPNVACPLSPSSLPTKPLGSPHFVFERGLLASNYLVHALSWRYPRFCWRSSSEFLEMSAAPSEAFVFVDDGRSKSFPGVPCIPGAKVGSFVSAVASEFRLEKASVALWKITTALQREVEAGRMTAEQAISDSTTTRMFSSDDMEAYIYIIARGEPAGKSPVRESSLLSFRLLSLLSTATHFIRSLVVALH